MRSLSTYSDEIAHCTISDEIAVNMRYDRNTQHSDEIANGTISHEIAATSQ